MIKGYICRGFMVGILLSQTGCPQTPLGPAASDCADEGSFIIANQSLSCVQVMVGLADLMHRRPECAGIFGPKDQVTFVCLEDGGPNAQ